MIKIDNSLLEEVCQGAKTSPRKRKNFNFHCDNNEPVQRMLNALEPGTYVRPHKHETPDKKESFIILKGRVLVIEFDHKGNIRDSVLLDLATGNFGIEIPPRTYHTVISLEPGSIVYEVKDGPYDFRLDKDFAEWAPEEGTAEAGDYLKGILHQLSI
jgi:cupin fold WbuC family metalloprotein